MFHVTKLILYVCMEVLIVRLVVGRYFSLV